MASLTILEDDGRDAGSVLPAAGDGRGTPGSELTQLPETSSSQMMIYSGASAPTGKSSRQWCRQIGLGVWEVLLDLLASPGKGQSSPRCLQGLCLVVQALDGCGQLAMCHHNMVLVRPPGLSSS